ncbi:MAG TPA: META domain-containing protein [Glaciibacter sp.]|nr:META domain-containing protein [Glaciibacter sp.]
MSVQRLLVLTGTCVVAVGMLAACAGAPGASSHGDSGSHNAPAETTADQLVGTWVVGERFETPTQPYLTIIDDGTWRGSDGCNGVVGTWELASGGKLEVTAGPTTMMFCEGKPLPTLFAEANAASVADETLTLMDGAGNVTATLPAGREEIIPLESE